MYSKNSSMKPPINTISTSSSCELTVKNITRLYEKHQSKTLIKHNFDSSNIYAIEQGNVAQISKTTKKCNLNNDTVLDKIT